ncbi:MAG TPA: hypothetical protein VGJ20_28830 [Xanthobacteraceae bacterium]|jgi:hypothetical protein
MKKRTKKTKKPAPKKPAVKPTEKKAAAPVKAESKPVETKIAPDFLEYCPQLRISITGERIPANAVLHAAAWPPTINVNPKLGDVFLRTPDEINHKVVKFHRSYVRIEVCDSYAIYNKHEEVKSGISMPWGCVLKESGGRCGKLEQIML